MATLYYVYKNCSNSAEYQTADLLNGTLTLNKVYYFTISKSGETPITSCFEILSGETLGTYQRLQDGIEFNSCEECTPVSAGTEYFVCQICGDASGSTATQITVPHPVWTRPNGASVTLLDAVQLGGMFGLNS